MYKKIIILALFAICVSGNVFAANLKGNTVVLGTLDKLTGRVDSIEVKVGETTKFQALEVRVFSCFYKPPEEAPDNMVFLNIREINNDETDEEKRVKQHFNGWMFSSSPAVSALEHSVYDIWSIECKNVIEEEKDKALEGEKEIQSKE